MKILFKLNPYLQQRQREKEAWIFPIKLAMYATYLRDRGHEIIWDGEETAPHDLMISSDQEIDVPFLELPIADRTLTDGKNKKWQQNGNFLKLPGTYIQCASSCWWSKCSFCVENGRGYQVRPVEKVIDELRDIYRLGFKEVFDDSGTFPVGSWLTEFLRALTRCDYPFHMGCNLRLVDVDYKAMRSAKFRMVLFGIESANQETLDRIHKGTKTSDIKWIRKASKAGLDCHGAFMFGYPWETEEDAQRTLDLAHKLLKDGTLRTAQASLYTNTGEQSNLWGKKYVKRLYDVWKSPRFWKSQIGRIRDWDDIKYLGRCIREGLR